MPDPLDLDQAYEFHQQADIHGTKLREYIHNVVLGGNDGIVTTFAVIAGAIGGQLSYAAVIILGLANLFADGISMGAGVFLSMKSERDRFRRLRKEELQEIDDDPAIEREEVRRAFKAKGFEGEVLERVVETLTANKERWVDAMMHEEHGLIDQDESHPLLNALTTFLSFVVFGSIPLLPFLVAVPDEWRFTAALISTVLALVLLGVTRSFVTQERIFKGPSEIVGIGLLCAFVAYGVGAFLRTIVGIAV